MLDKEKIEKAKEMLSNPKKEDLIEIIRIFKRNGIENYCITKNETIKTLLQYIQELEISNIELDKENNRLEKIEFERDIANKIIDKMAEQLAGIAIWNNEKEEPLILMDKEEVKQYYEKKVEGK